MTKVRDRRRISRVTVEELLDEMHRSVDGLGEDGASRADLKLLSRTLKELRHAFRFFDGLRGRPKVTVFGSARLPAGSPAYRQAESFDGDGGEPASHPNEIFFHQEAALSQGVERRRPLSRRIRDDGRGVRGVDPSPNGEERGEARNASPLAAASTHYDIIFFHSRTYCTYRHLL